MGEYARECFFQSLLQRPLYKNIISLSRAIWLKGSNQGNSVPPDPSADRPIQTLSIYTLEDSWMWLKYLDHILNCYLTQVSCFSHLFFLMVDKLYPSVLSCISHYIFTYCIHIDITIYNLKIWQMYKT